MDTNSVEIFYIIDELCKEIEKTMKGHILANGMSQKKHNRAFTMSESEVITIMVLFHQSHFRYLKFFYNHYIKVHCKKDFPHTVSYNRFVELQQKALLPMVVFLRLCCLDKCTGIPVQTRFYLGCPIPTGSTCQTAPVRITQVEPARIVQTRYEPCLNRVTYPVILQSRISRLLSVLTGSRVTCFVILLFTGLLRSCQ